MSITEIFSYGFMQRALLSGVLVGMLCAVLGVFLVLRRLSLIGDGLSHVTFGSVALALALRAKPLYVTLAALPIVLLSSLGILKLTDKARIYGDAAIGIVSAAGIAGGMILAGASGGFNVDLFSYLFGNILAISSGELLLALLLFCVVMGTVVRFYHELFAITFDEDLARCSGIRVERINGLLAVLTSLTVVLAMKVVGILLVSSLLIIPAVTALQVARGFRTTMVAAALFAVLAVVTGIILSFVMNLPTGGVIVLINILFFMLAFSWRKLSAVSGR
ncbi:MAG TPA: metal ABC transporter permease [Geobacteraceae bacterium]|nr:metal ABC transporter permease [Geobacteraceae bacterium]